MAYTTISKHTDHFNTKLYTGNSGTQAITGVGHQPDLVWIKNRNDSNNQSHVLYDSVRGVTKYISSNSDGAEGTEAAGVTAFGTDGFTVGNTVTVNTGFNYVSWNWKGGTTSGLSGGTITPSSYSFNATAGFSIIKYTGNGNSSQTVPHGLGKAPKMILFKDTTNASTYWGVYHKEIGTEYRLTLNNNSVRQGTSANYWSSTDPSSSLFYIGSNSRANASGAVTIAYCFAEIDGYSKINYYEGNGDATNPPFIYTGFKPKFVMVKCFNEADDWFMHDDKRDGYNDDNEYLFASIANAEGSNVNRIRLFSNGFSVPTTDKSHNKSGNSYVYYAVGQSLVGSNNVPCTAR